MSSTLQLTSYHGEVGPFPVSSVIVTGESDAVLIDAQFTLADGTGSSLWSSPPASV